MAVNRPLLCSKNPSTECLDHSMYGCRQSVQKLHGVVKTDIETRDQIAQAAESRRKKYHDDNRDSWNEFKEMNERAMQQGFKGVGNSPILKLGGMPRSTTVPPPRMYADPYLSDTLIGRAADARRKFGIFRPGPKTPPPPPELKITDPDNHFGDDPSKMDNYLNGSPDKGMWWLQGVVDQNYRASTPYAREMRARRAAGPRTPQGKPRYY